MSLSVAKVATQACAMLCAVTVLLYPISFGVNAAVGSVGFFVAIQTGIFHVMRLAGRNEFTSLRIATSGLALGVTLAMHFTLRATYGPDMYMEYASNPPFFDNQNSLLPGITVALGHFVIPITTLLVLRGILVVNPLLPMLLVTTDWLQSPSFTIW